MKHKTRILTLRTISVLVLVALLAALSPPSLHTGGVALAQAGPPELTATSAGATSIDLAWSAVGGADGYRVIRWHSGPNWDDVEPSGGGSHTTTTFTDTGLTTGTNYFYQVTAVTGAVEGGWSNRANAIAGSLDAPVLDATASIGQIDLTWNTVPGAVSYNLIYWTSGLPAWEELGGTIRDTSYPHPSLTNGADYFYQVRAVNDAGTNSDWSNRLTVTVPQPGRPGAPTSVDAAYGNGEVTLTWTAPTSSGGSDITSYQYRYREMGGTWEAWKDDVGLALEDTIMGLTNGTTYEFEVQAMNAEGAGPSGSDSATPATVPDAPSLTAEGTGTDRIRLTWTAPTDNGGDEIDRYHIEILNDQGTYSLVTNVPGNATTYTHTGRDRATDYTYRVLGENVAGKGDWDSATARTLANPVQRPTAPTAVLATAGSGKVDLTWSAPAFNGGAPITAYQYSYKVTPGGSYRSYIGVGTDLKATIPNLIPGTAYIFAVQAINSAGTSDAAESDSVTVAATAPTAKPTLNLNLDTDGNENTPRPQITLSWNVVAPANNGGSPITGYKIEYKESGDEGWTPWDPDATGFTGPTAAENGQSYSAIHGDQSLVLKPGTTYEYRVRAINNADGDATGGQSPDDTGAADGQIEENGPWSDVKSMKTKAVAPGIPTLHPVGGQVANGNDPALAAWTLDVASITVRWVAPDAGGSPITSYQLRVSTNTDGSVRFTAADTEDAVINNLPGDRMEYTHTGLKSEEGYYYSIRALNNADGDRVSGEHPDDANAQANQIAERSDWSPSSTVATTTVARPGTPGVPTGGTASEEGSTGTVTFGWGEPDNEGPLPVTSYDVQYQRTDDDRVDDWSDATTDNPHPPTNNSYVHRGLEGGSTYQYRVRAVNGNGAGGWTTIVVSVDINERAPEAPDLKARSGGATEIVLEWMVPENNGTTIEGYTIQQWNPDDGNGGDWGSTDLLQDAQGDEDNADVTLLTVDMLTAGTEYFFRIQTEAAGGGTNSDWSADTTDDAVSATTDSGVPAMVALTLATGDDPGTIELTWVAPANGGSDITGYEIQVFDISNRSWVPEITLAGDATSYTDENLEPGKRYYYTIAAKSSAGSGPWTQPPVDELSGAANPDAVDDLTATAKSRTSIELTWTAPDNNGTPITGYQLQRWDPDTGDGGEWGTDNLLASNTVIVTEFTDTDGTDGLQAGTKYYYRVRALPQVDEDDTADPDAGWSADDMEDGVSATTHGDVPGEPQSLATASGDNAPTIDTIMLMWAAPVDLGGSTITGYKLQVWDSASSRWVDEATPTGTSYTDRGLTAGTTYYYRVAAVNSHGAGPYTTPYLTTATENDAIDEPVLVATAFGPNEIRLTWNVPAANGNTIGGYVLNKWNGSDWDTLSNLLPADHPADTVLYIDRTGTVAGEPMAADERYDYRIMATVSGGGSASGWAYADAKTAKDVPARPVLTAEADGSDAIDLSWDAPDDNGSEIQTYTVEYWVTGSGWTILTTTVGQTRTATHSTLEPGTTYVYRLTATNRVGTSMPSTLVSARTAAAE